MRTCKNPSCKTKFEATYNSIQPCCSVKCAIELGRVKTAQKASKAHKQRKIDLRDTDRSWHTKKAQAAFNKFIRLRDALDACISCGRHHGGQYHAGHYRSTGAAPELRFNELNCHKQCAPCNNHKSGNIGEYRIQLIGKIGIHKVELIEGNHPPKKYTIDELKEITAHYRALVKEMEND